MFETHAIDNLAGDEAMTGSDETGFRIPAGRDLNSGPERGIKHILRLLMSLSLWSLLPAIPYHPSKQKRN